MTTAISIIVPVYNLEFYLERCLASLERQTLQNIEFLVVDDGSTDDSSMLVDEYGARDARFRVFHKPNGGHGSACNYGIERATGEYVMIVDGDDFLDPDTCAFMYAKAREHDADLLMGNLKYFLTGGRLDVFRPIDIDGERLLDEQDRVRLFSNWATPCARLYRRSLFEDPAVRFLPGIIFADVNFAPKTIYAARRIYYVNRELYNYDVTRPTQSMKQTDKKILNVVPALRDMLDFYKRKGAFEQHAQELMVYTLRHVISWLDRVRVLDGYPRAAAVSELFGVLDTYFGDAWQGQHLEREAGRRRALAIRRGRRFDYALLVWWWQFKERAHAADDRVEAALGLPVRAYRRLKVGVKNSLARGHADGV